MRAKFLREHPHHVSAKELKRNANREEKAVRWITIRELRFVEGLTLQAIGDKLGLSRERIRQIIKNNENTRIS